MKLLTYVTKGKAWVTEEGLRCAAPREDSPELICHKLLAKKNEAGQIAGNFRCKRCKQEIEVTLSPPRNDVTVGKSE